MASVVKLLHADLALVLVKLEGVPKGLLEVQLPQVVQVDDSSVLKGEQHLLHLLWLEAHVVVLPIHCHPVSLGIVEISIWLDPDIRVAENGGHLRGERALAAALRPMEGECPVADEEGCADDVDALLLTGPDNERSYRIDALLIEGDLQHRDIVRGEPLPSAHGACVCSVSLLPTSHSVRISNRYECAEFSLMRVTR